MSLINDALKRARKQTRARPRLNVSTHETLEPVGESSWTPASAGRNRSTPWPWIIVAVLSLGLCLILAGWFFGSAITSLRNQDGSPDSQPSPVTQGASANPAQSANPDGQYTEPEPGSAENTFAGKDDLPSANDSSDLKSNESEEFSTNITANDPVTGSGSGSDSGSESESESETSFQNHENAINPAPFEPTTPPPVTTAKVYLTKIPAEGGWPELKLQGIFYDADAPVALINNRDLLAGESLGKVRVISIESKKVTLQLGQEQKILQFRR